MKLALTRFGLRYPWITLALVGLLTVGLGYQMQYVHFDNDPENMLAEDEPVRLFHHEVKDRYDLYDFVIVGIVNEQHPDGIFNTETLGKIHRLTNQLISLERGEDGLPTVRTGDRVETIDLGPESNVRAALDWLFHHDPNRLFDAQGETAIITREIISPSVVDNIEQADLGSLEIAYLMEEAPTTREQALEIRDDAMSNPLYAGTLVSEDEKAICLYLPITEKSFSHNVAGLVHHLTEGWEANGDQVYITGLPVAEDTFGVEMLIQMATSAPMAGIAIFILMFIFFKRISLIIAPMLVAVISIVWTMGLLIGLGFDVHIMSSMIAIFLMPIAVADAVHILSEFYDTYGRIGNKSETVRHVVGHLFSPMLYTTLTTVAGFASLAATPIPPVRVFGLHVAFGVFSAWLLTMVLIPAYIELFVSERSLTSLAKRGGLEAATPSRLGGLLEGLGGFSFRHAKPILVITAVVLAVSAFGISRIVVNDNPVKWFTAQHPIRVADDVLNRHFGGTYTAYLTFSPGEEAARVSPADHVREEIAALEGAQRRRIETALEGIETEGAADPSAFFRALEDALADDRSAETEAWLALEDTLLYLDTADLTRASLLAELAAADIEGAVLQRFTNALGERGLRGEDLLDRALEICAEQRGGAIELVGRWAAAYDAPLFKRPEMLRYLDALQADLESRPVVGKTSSAVDALKKAAFELQYIDPAGDEEIAATNRANFSVPDTVAAAGQVFTQLEGMKKKDSLFHLVTRDYQQANLWVQLTSGDNRDMESVRDHVAAYIRENPPPRAVETGWAGLTYINVVWQEKMVRGMLGALGSSFVIVLLMMMVLFRSPKYGVLAMIPLTVTISFIYGLIGLVGKEYDMPVAVLSALTLGLSIDFAIHFLQRSRELVATHGSWREAVTHVFREPATAISRNAITISVGFTPLLLAPLVPYKTVGFFLATIMAVSWMATLFILAALATLMRRTLFPEEAKRS